MSFNYTNLGNLQNMHSLFSSASNAAANVNQFNLQMNAISQLAASAATASTSTPSTSSTFNRNRRASTPEAPPAPRLSAYSDDSKQSGITNKADQGALDMDIDAEPDTTISVNEVTQSNAASTTGPAAAAKTASQLPQLAADALLLNSLMAAGHAGGAAQGCMFFPSTPYSMLMDNSALMAAAMKTYGSFLPTTATTAATATNATLDAEQTAAFQQQQQSMTVTTKNCTLFPPNPNAPPPTIRDRPPGCRTVFVGGLPELATEELIREIFESCGEITTLRMSKKNFCHIRYRSESAIERAIFLSGYRVRISASNEPANFGRLHVDYAQARDDQYDYECRQRQLQREQRHRDRVSIDRMRSQSPPPIAHYTEHEASLVSESLRNNDSFVKAVQTITIWLERGDCNKRNANMFYSMIQSTHAHVRRLHTDKQQLEEELRKARESYRKQMLIMSKQFTQIEKVFNAASHKKVWDHFSKAQRKNIDQWKKLATELRSVQIEDDEMEMSDDDRETHSSRSAKRARYDNGDLKDENDSLRCQLEAMRNEMCLERTDSKCDNDFREKQIKVLQETIRNMQTQLLQTKNSELKDQKYVEQLEHKLKESAVKQLLLKTKIRETLEKLKERGNSSRNSEISELVLDELDVEVTECNAVVPKIIEPETNIGKPSSTETETAVAQVDTIIDLDLDNDQDNIQIIEDPSEVVEILDGDEVQIVMENMVEKKTIDETAESKMSPDSAIAVLEKHETLQPPASPHLALNEARIIALTATYLMVHPLGVDTAKICEYLNQIMEQTELTTNSLADILKNYSNLFTFKELIEELQEQQQEQQQGQQQEQQQHQTKDDKESHTFIWKFCGYTRQTATVVSTAVEQEAMEQKTAEQE